MNTVIPQYMNTWCTKFQSNELWITYSLFILRAEYIVNYQNNNYIMNEFKITDFMLSQWFIVDVDMFLVLCTVWM